MRRLRLFLLLLLCSSALAGDDVQGLTSKLLDLQTSPAVMPLGCKDCAMQEISQGPAPLPAASPSPAVNCSAPFTKACMQAASNPDAVDLSFAAVKQVHSNVKAVVREGFKKENLAKLAFEKLKADGIPLGDISKLDEKAFLLIEDEILQDWYGAADTQSMVAGTRDLIAAFGPTLLRDCEDAKRTIVNKRDSAKDYQKAKTKVFEQTKALADFRASLIDMAKPREQFLMLMSYCKGLPKDHPAKQTLCAPPSLVVLSSAVRDTFADESNPEIGPKKEKRFTESLKILFAALPETTGKLKPLNDELELACSSAGYIYTYLTAKSLYELRGEISRSKEMVAKTEQTFYPPQKRAKMDALYAEIKNRVASLFEREIAPAAKLDVEQAQKTSASLRALPLMQPASYHDSDFANADKPKYSYLQGVQTLKKEAFEGAESGEFHVFMNESLSSLTEMNAFYTKKFVLGETATPESVTVLGPGYLKFEENPGLLFQVIAHEVGHKIDPINMKLSKNPVASAYGKLQDCLKKHLNMQEGQEGESVADWISARCLADYIGELKPEQSRIPALMTAVKTYCEAYPNPLEEVKSLQLVHPSSMLRMNRIWGRVPGIRKILGCPVVPACGMQGEYTPFTSMFLDGR